MKSNGRWQKLHVFRGAVLAGLLCLGLALAPSRLGAQATEGSILGSVADASGAVLPNATVTVTGVDTGLTRTTKTNEAGEFVVTNLSVGSYRVAVEAKGFKKLVHPPVTLTVKARVRVDSVLELGDVSQTVEVASAAPLIKTDTPEVGGVIPQRVLNMVPVFGRNFLALSALVPGTTNGPASSRQRDFSGAAVTIGGASAEANNFILDGISDNMEFSGATGVMPAIDAIQEFAIQTSLYSAEFGRSGGGVVNVAIKSGTNEFHGFAYDYLRNDKLDARAYDFTGTNPAKQPIRRNQFGGGLGGPIIKNRVFFFGNYEGTRFPNSSLGSAIVPTALEKSGDFSRSGFDIFDPTTTHKDPANPNRSIRNPFPGNVIPSLRFEPIAVKMLSFFPDPNYVDPNPNVRNNYLSTRTNNDSLDSFNLKGDYSLSANDMMMTRYSQQRGGRSRSGWMPNNVVGADSSLDATNAAITYTRVLQPTLVNEARIGYNYLRFGNEMGYHDNVMDAFKVPGWNTVPIADGLPSFSMRNYSGVAIERPIASVPTPFLLVEHSWQYMDNLSWQKGSHALKFGGELQRVANNRFQGRNGGGGMNFGGNYTTPVVGQGLETLRNGVPDALLGLADSFYTNYAQDAVRIRSERFSGFVQDDWRWTKKLTLSLGLRYEFFGPYHEEQNRFGNFDVRTGERVIPESTRSIVENVLHLPGGQLPAGWRYDALSKVIPKANYTNFSPRFGFAYAANSRVVVRGGYGIFYGVTVSNNANNSGTEGSPFFFDFSLPAELDNPIVIRQGFPVGGISAPLSQRTFGAYYAPLSRHDPYTEKWNVNLELSPFRKTAVEIGYSGQHAIAFPTLVPGNSPLPGPGAVQDRRPYPNVGFFWQFLPVNDSNYNGLEITLRQQEWHGLAVQSAFTFSKSLGYSTGTDGTLTDPYNLRYDYGPLPYDYTRRWVTSYIYRIPTPKDLPAFARHILGNWESSGLITLQGGFPFSVGVSGQVMNNGLGGNRADVLHNPVLPVGERTRDRWFDTTAFGMPANYVWGNQGKGILRVPGLAVVDFALQKNIPLTERKRLAFRMEATNFFNRVQLGQPSSTLGGTNFGVIRGLQAGPRNIQMVLRLDF